MNFKSTDVYKNCCWIGKIVHPEILSTIKMHMIMLQNLIMQNYKDDFSNKYKNSFKAAALATKYKRCLTNSYQSILIPTSLCPCDIEH